MGPKSVYDLIHGGAQVLAILTFVMMLLWIAFHPTPQSKWTRTDPKCNRCRSPATYQCERCEWWLCEACRQGEEGGEICNCSVSPGGSVGFRE